MGKLKDIVKRLINSYVTEKRWFIADNYDFAWTKEELLTREDSLETTLNETVTYIEFIKDHFTKADEEIKTHQLSIVAERLDRRRQVYRGI